MLMQKRGQERLGYVERRLRDGGGVPHPIIAWAQTPRDQVKKNMCAPYTPHISPSGASLRWIDYQLNLSLKIEGTRVVIFR